MTTLASIGGHASYVASGRPVAAVMAHAALTRAARLHLDDVAVAERLALAVALDLATVEGEPEVVVRRHFAERSLRWEALEGDLVAAWTEVFS